MSSSLMSVFDPCSTVFNMNIPLGWFSMVMVIYLVKTSYWTQPSGLSLFWSFLWDYLYNSLTVLFKNSKCTANILISLFSLILSVNLIGLLPWSFSVSSHISFTLSLSVVLWLGGLAYHWKVNKEEVLSHMTPSGLALPMAIFLVWIELISLLLRPVSLGVRLMANMTAGHMLMVLSENAINSLSPSSLSSFMVLCVIITFEMGVAVIQAYVFMSLMSLYWEDNNLY